MYHYSRQPSQMTSIHWFNQVATNITSECKVILLGNGVSALDGKYNAY